MASSSRNSVRRHEFYQELIDVLVRELTEFGLAEDAATLIATTTADNISDYWGGQVICFPKDVAYKLSKLELEVYDKFKGNNADALAREHNMSLRGMNKLLARVRAKIAASRKDACPDQLDLLDSGA